MFGFSSPFRAPKSVDRRPRNPRFAPESLERRLHPSCYAGLVSYAEVEMVAMESPEPMSEYDGGATEGTVIVALTPEDPEPAPNPDGTTPVEPMPIPEGPVLPA